MSLPLAFEPEVKDEVDEAYTWCDQQQGGLGEEFLEEIQVALERIQQNPELRAVIYRDVRRASIRRFPYAVYYRIEPGRLTVIAVHHTKRDPRRWQSRV
ncbi:MAG: type II toxin-antitoxin system RelE/ParE family toxin [Isosphaeraceae bacterium]